MSDFAAQLLGETLKTVARQSEQNLARAELAEARLAALAEDFEIVFTSNGAWALEYYSMLLSDGRPVPETFEEAVDRLREGV